MLDKLLVVYKKTGETPLDCINELKISNENLRYLPMTYAGRLDPLAEGLLLILVGEECMKKDEYLDLEKEYEVEVLFGFDTDTHDLMGKVTNYSSGKEVVRITEENLSFVLDKFIGTIIQKYPQYSSRTVDGKPLFQWAREGKIDEVEIPEHKVVVEGIEILNIYEISSSELLSNIINVIGKVKGDFRQSEILQIWNETLKDSSTDTKIDTKYQVAKLRIRCGTGFYVRVLAHDLGQYLGCSSLAFKIVRTRIGDFVC